MSQVLLDPRDTHTHVQRANTRAAVVPSRELLTAWLLLLLDRKASHGYELRRQLEVHGLAAESGAMYRALRKLDKEGFAASMWAESDAGPRKRHYRLTPKGRRELAELAEAITVKRDVHSAFLTVHGREAAAAQELM